MSEPRDDTPERSRAPRPAADPEPQPGGYYYDDGTGYEPYRPDEDEAEREGEAAPAAETPPRNRQRQGPRAL